MIVFLFVPLIVGTPIAFALGFSSISVILVFMRPNQLIQLTSIVLNNGTSSTMLVVPMFVLMAEILIVSGITKDIFDAAHKWLGRLPGGLGVAVIATCAGFASVTGSSGATVATIGSMSVPEMLKRNYSTRLSAGCVVTGGTLGFLIPPSMSLIVYGLITEVSIAKLFLAGVIPGIIVAILLSLVIIGYARVKPENAPKGDWVPLKEKYLALIKALPVVMLALFIIVSLYTGIATPTESAAVGVMASIIISLVMGRLTLNKLIESLIKSAKTTSMVLMLVFGGMTFAFVVGYLGIPEKIVENIIDLNLSRWMVFILLIFILIVLGCFIETIGMMLVTLPFMFPIINQLGFDPVWFGIIVTLTAEIGLISPPIGMNLFVLKATVPDLQLTQIIAGSVPFILVLFVAIALFSIFPQLVTLLVQ
ncbi:MAG: TRAP transporter large permease subunit [Deltaproteobacteria bacterium]|nr:TRAP transporter large permease subunit [Deltaproteobacteria bacterium]